jgi:hypothetical protein
VFGSRNQGSSTGSTVAEHWQAILHEPGSMRSTVAMVSLRRSLLNSGQDRSPSHTAQADDMSSSEATQKIASPAADGRFARGQQRGSRNPDARCPIYNNPLRLPSDRRRAGATCS